MENSRNGAFHYLDDNEIILNGSNDLIGTSIYAKILKDVFIDTSGNFYTETIALSGRWGSGKSSIVKSLEADFESTKFKINNRNVKFFSIMRGNIITTVLEKHF